MDDYTFAKQYRAAVDYGKRMRQRCMKLADNGERIEVTLTPDGELRFKSPDCTHHFEMRNAGETPVCTVISYINPYSTEPIELNFAGKFTFDPEGPCIVARTAWPWGCKLAPYEYCEWLMACRFAPGIFETPDMGEFVSIFRKDEICMVCGVFTRPRSYLCSKEACHKLVSSFGNAAYFLWWLKLDGPLCVDVCAIVEGNLAALLIKMMHNT